LKSEVYNSAVNAIKSLSTKCLQCSM